MATTKAQQKAVTKYVKAKYDRFGLTMPKGNLDIIKAHAESRGKSVNGFINEAIDNQIERDGSGGASEAIQRPDAAGSGRMPSDTVEYVSIPSNTTECATIPPDTLEAVQEVTAVTKEAVTEYVTRSVKIQMKRDKLSIQAGVNPATGEKLETDDKTKGGTE